MTLAAKDTAFYTKKTLNIRGKIVDLSSPKVMGIINLTPDSFYDGGYYRTEKQLANQIEKMVAEGADFIDIGAYSSRPGAEEISFEEEMKRIQQGLQIIDRHFSQLIISVDTFRAQVAKLACENGASLINDISGGTLDPDMFTTVAQLDVPYIMMHMRGNPKSMNHLTKYDNLLKEILEFFKIRLFNITNLGVKDVIIDVGFGFAKSIGQNYELLKNLSYFQILNAPILAGLSRKSMIYKNLGATPQNALNGTTVLNTVALVNGASILRVHDVREAKEAIKLFELTYRSDTAV